MRCYFLLAALLRHGQNFQIHGFRRIVGVGDFVVVIEYGCRRADTRTGLTRHNLRVRVHIGYDYMSLGDRRCKHVVCGYQRGVVCAVPAVFVNDLLSVGYGAQFGKPDEIIYRAERFAARPFVIFPGNGKKAFPGCEIGKQNIIGGGESGENSACDEEHISRF